MLEKGHQKEIEITVFFYFCLSSIFLCFLKPSTLGLVFNRGS